MPPPDGLHHLLPVAFAMALLLTAGVAAGVHLVSRRSASFPPWKTGLEQLARATPWRGGDLPILLLLVATAQFGRRFLSSSVVWDMLAFQGVLVAGILWRARHKALPFGTTGPWHAVAGQAILRWLAILPVLWFAAFVWQLGLHAVGHAPDLQNAIQLFMTTDDPWFRVLFLLFAILLAPFAEEVLFRGLMLPLLIRRTGALAGLALTAIGFAALHANLGTFLALALFSIALSLAYARTGSLWVPMVMHALFNGTSLVLLLALVRAGVLK